MGAPMCRRPKSCLDLEGPGAAIGLAVSSRSGVSTHQQAERRRLQYGRLSDLDWSDRLCSGGSAGSVAALGSDLVLVRDRLPDPRCGGLLHLAGGRLRVRAVEAAAPLAVDAAGLGGRVMADRKLTDHEMTIVLDCLSPEQMRDMLAYFKGWDEEGFQYAVKRFGGAR